MSPGLSPAHLTGTRSLLPAWRRIAYKTALFCFVTQAVILTIALICHFLQWTPDEDLTSLLSLVMTLANSLMWFSIFAPWVYDWTRGRNDQQDQLLVIRQLGDMLKMGIPLPEALQALGRHERSSWRSRFAPIARAVQLMAESTAEGDMLGQAMGRVGIFPAHWPQLVLVAEKKGALVEVLEDLEDGRSPQSWFTFWFVIRLVMLGMLGIPIAGFLVVYILPTFVTLFEGMNLTLPTTTVILISVTKTLRNPWVATPLSVLIGAAALVWLLAGFVNSVSARCRLFFSHIPPFRGVFQLEEQAVAAGTISTCLRLGLEPDDALTVASNAVNLPAYREALKPLIHAPGATQDIAKAFLARPDLFASPLRWLAAQGQAYHNLEVALAAAAQYLKQEADSRKARVAIYLETGSALLLGLVVAVAVLGTNLPIVEMIAELFRQLVEP